MEQSKKIYKLPVKNYYRALLQLMGFISPFSEMRPRQMDIFAELLILQNKYKDYPNKERSRLIFDGVTWKDMAEKLNTSFEVVTNVISELRKKEFIININGFEEINPKYVFEKVDLVCFNFIEE